MPVHAHHGAEGLIPERMRKPAQYFVSTVVKHDGFHDHAPERGHARGEPWRHLSAMQRKIRAAATSGCHRGIVATFFLIAERNVARIPAFSFYELDADITRARVAHHSHARGDSRERAPRTVARDRLAALAGRDLGTARLRGSAPPADRSQKAVRGNAGSGPEG